MRHHGVPDAVIDGNETFWEFIRTPSDAWRTDVRLGDGDRIRAGGRDLRVVARPGHSTTDTLFVDERDGLAFVGDHLLAGVSSNTEIYPAAEPDGTRPRARVEYLGSLRRTAAMPLARLLTGHGDDDHRSRRLVAERFGRAPSADATGSSRCSGRPGDRVRDRPAAVVAAHGGRAAPARGLGGARPPRPAARRGARQRAGDRRRSATASAVRGAPATSLTVRPASATSHALGGGGLHEPADTLTDVADARDLFDLSGRVAVVTGGTRGLGLAMARGFAQAGAEVVVVSRKAGRLRGGGGRAARRGCQGGARTRATSATGTTSTGSSRTSTATSVASTCSSTTPGVSPRVRRAHRGHRGALRQGRSAST